MATTKSAEPQTQGTIPSVISILIDTLVDKDNVVSDSVRKSLRAISEKHANDVLKIACQFCNKNRDIKSPSRNHVTVVLCVMETVTRDNIVMIDGDTMLDLIAVSLDFMTQHAQLEPAIQTPSVGILVALGTKHCVQIVDCLTEKITPGIAPHFSIAQCFGSVAAANVFGIVPALKPIMGLLMPLLSGLKHDHVKRAFTYCLGSFSEAIVEYTANLQQVPDSTITKDFFATEMSMTFDVLFAQLLHAREQKLVEETLYAVSSIFTILSTEKVRLNALKAVQALLNLFKRHKESYPVTKCLSSVLTITTQTDGTLLEQQVPPLLQALADLIFIAPDYAQPERLRTHTEALRCYQTVCAFYTDHSIDHLLVLVKNNNEKDKVRGLVVLTHLANASGDSLRNRLSDVMAVVGEQVNSIRVENSVWVHRALMKAVVAFAYKEFLPSTGIETEKYLEYLVYLCIKTNQLNVTTSDSMEMSDLKQSAGNNLYMLTTSSKYLEGILTRLLIQCLLKLDYLEGSVVLLRCLTHLASKSPIKNSTDAEDLFIRCFALLSQPIGQFRGSFIFNFLKHVKLYEDDKNWEPRILKLIKYLEQNYEMFNTTEWEELLFEFLHNVLESADDPAVFAARLLEAVSSQMPNYNCISAISDVSLDDKHTAEKRHLLIALGIIGSYLTDEKIISRVLDLILSNAKPHNTAELQATAKSMAICSKVHFKTIINKLASVRKDALVKKGTKLFSFSFIRGEQKGDIEMERIRYVIISSYKEICSESDAEVLRIVEGEMLNFVLGELTTCKDFVIRKIALEAITSIAQLLHPARNTLHVRLLDKDSVVQTVAAQLQLHSGPDYIELFPVVIPALTALARLPQPLEPAQRQYLLKLVFDNVFNASAIYCKLKNENDSDTASIKSTDSYGNLKLSPFIHASFPLLNSFLCAILSQTLTPDGLDEISTLLEPWLGKKKIEQRLPALEALRAVLDYYLEGVQFAYDVPTSFGQAGWLLARVVPRVTDPCLGARRAAVACVRAVLAICGRYEGLMKDHDQHLLTLTTPLLTLTTISPPSHLIPSQLAHLITHHLPPHQLTPFTLALIEHGLLDAEPESSAGCAGVLEGVAIERGAELQSVVGEIVVGVIGVMGRVKCARVKVGVMEGVAKLARHHMKAVVGVLLGQPLPYEPSVRQLFSTLGSDPTLLAPLLDHLKHLITSSAAHLITAPCTAHQQTLVDVRPFQAVSALEQVVQCVGAVAHVHGAFADWLTLLAVGVRGAYVGAAVGGASGGASGKSAWNRDAYKICPGKVAGAVVKWVLGGSDVADCGDSVAAFTAMLPAFTAHICHYYPHHLTWIVTCLGPYLRSDIELQRVAAATFLTELISSRTLLGQLGTRPPKVPKVAEMTAKDYPVQQEYITLPSPDNEDLLLLLHRTSPITITADQLVLADNIVEMMLDISSGRGRGRGGAGPSSDDTVREDEGARVRCLCMRALGAAAGGFYMGKLVQRHCGRMVGVLMRGLDYGSSSEWDVALEAMLSLSTLIRSLTPTSPSSPTTTSSYAPLGQLHVTAAVRIKPLFQHENAQLRRAAVQLLGDLATSVDAAQLDGFREQVLGNLMTVLLHLVDVDADVVKACKLTLRNVGPLLDCPRINTMIQDHVFENGTLHFNRFITDLVQCMQEEISSLFPQLVSTCVFCLRSPWWEIRAGAALTAGLLYSRQLDTDDSRAQQQQQSSLDTVCYRLTQLLKDDRAEVRASAASALALVVNT